METVLCIIFLTLLVVSVVVAIIVRCEYENELKDSETKAQAEEIANKIEIAFKDMEIKRLEEEINKLKKRKKSK